MPLLPWLRSLIRNLAHRREAESELDAEVQSYVNLLAAEKQDQGMTPEVAQRAAKLELGGVEQVKEQTREVRAGAWVEAF